MSRPSQKVKSTGKSACATKVKRAGRSDFRTPVESIGLPKPEMPGLRSTNSHNEESTLAPLCSRMRFARQIVMSRLPFLRQGKKP
jgi:hypothetical protein